MKRITIERRAFLSSVGLNPDEVLGWVGKWRNLKGDAKGYGREFTLSFEEYVTLAKDAGLTSVNQIGQSIDSYCMGRLGDSGGYVNGNCRFITQRQNLQERKTNGGASLVGKIPGRRFEAISPDGMTYTGDNLSEFCRNRGLDQGNMSLTFNGSHSNHKGWTGRYLDGNLI